MKLNKVSRRNNKHRMRGGSGASSARATVKSSAYILSPDTIIQRLYEKMPKEISGKKITDDLVAYFDDVSKTYYVGLHAKDYDGTDKMDGPFVRQMNAFGDWVMNDVGRTHTVILATDFNTECIIHPNSPDTLIYSNKDGKETKIQQTFYNRRIIKSSTEFCTTNKMRFMTAQLPKIYLAAKSKIDHIICFLPNMHKSSSIVIHHLPTRQIACKSGNIAFRTKDCYQESSFPSDHDAVLFHNVATFNCCSSGASFDGDSLAHNTYEFFTDEMFKIFTEEANKKIVVDTYVEMLKVLNASHIFDKSGNYVLKLEESAFISNGLFSKDIDVFSKSRGEVFDIHLHSSFVPRIVVNGKEFSFTHTADQTKEQELIDATDEKRLRYNKWCEAFKAFLKINPDKPKTFKINEHPYKPDEYMVKIGVPLLNVWHELLRNETLKPHFNTWYDSSLKALHRELVVDFLFKSGANVVALQEIKLDDIDYVKRLPKYQTIWNERPVEGLSTVGCLIMKKA
jgi:hypothetical protein